LSYAPVMGTFRINNALESVKFWFGI